MFKGACLKNIAKKKQRRKMPIKKKKSPMQLSLQLMRDEGCRVGITERRLPIPRKFVTQDLFGFIDFLAIDRVKKIAIAVQTTTAANVASRVNKIKEDDAWLDWLAIPNHRIEVHGWALRKRGTKQRHYEVRRIEVNRV